MMSGETALLSTLRARGVQFVVAGSHLRFRPIEQVSPAERAALLKYKNGLIRLICDLDQLERDGTAAQLRTLAATLTPEEHERLRVEAAAGDRLAELVTAVLATPLEGAVVLRCRCGGTAWWPEPDGTAERCIACGEWSPCSMGTGGRR
jgi:hypothetical protein